MDLDLAFAVAVILAGATAAILGGWDYFRRYAITRPPIGVMDLGDVTYGIVGIILIPYLYLLLSFWVVLALLVLGTIAILLLVLEPVVTSRLTRWAIALGLTGADVALALTVGVESNVYLAVNNVVVLLTVLGVTNLWAQSGMRARDVAILGGFLAVYDLLATALSSVTTDMIERLTDLPFLPLFAWAFGDGQWAGIGLGDLLFATVFPLVARKAYGRQAGVIAMAVALATIVAVFAVGLAGWSEGAFPVMTVLGPLMVVQYLWWDRRLGPERTTAGYLQAEPLAATSAA